MSGMAAWANAENARIEQQRIERSEQMQEWLVDNQPVYAAARWNEFDHPDASAKDRALYGDDARGCRWCGPSICSHKEVP